jgi:hypothetical protein
MGWPGATKILPLLVLLFVAITPAVAITGLVLLFVTITGLVLLL